MLKICITHNSYRFFLE